MKRSIEIRTADGTVRDRVPLGPDGTSINAALRKANSLVQGGDVIWIPAGQWTLTDDES